MEKTAYEIVTVEERVLLIDIRRVHGTSRLYDVRCKKRVPLKTPIPDVQITENGYLHYRKEGRIFSCALTGREQTLIQAILAQADSILDDIFAVFSLDIWKNKDKNAVKNIISGLNRKMKREKMPLKVVLHGWRLSITFPSAR